MDSAQEDVGEKRRLASLGGLTLLDTPPQERFDRISKLAARVFSAPISGIALVDSKRVWYLSIVGLQDKQVEKVNSFDNYLISTNIDEPFVVEDALTNSLFSKNSLVTGGPKIRFYAGIALKSQDGNRIGTFFIADRIPRKLSDMELAILKDLAGWVALELNKSKEGQVDEELAKKNRELVEEKARHDAMLENIGDGVIGINDKGEVTFANNQVEVMTGWKQEELVGKLFFHAIKMEDENGNETLANYRPIRNALYSNKKVISREYYYVRKDNSKFPVAITATPVVIYGQVVGGVNVFRDITKEREIDRMKTEFISLASHQLRTPLSAMKWFSEILLDGDAGELNKDQLELLNNIYQSNERMITLVNTLLNISRIESGRIIIEPKPTDLRKLIEEVQLELTPKLKEKKHHLAVSVHENLPRVNIDPKLVRHVYINLLTNAIKYTPEGGEIVVMISKSGNEVISQISDNGLGIPKHQQDQVFKKFFRAENIARAETDGTGLGLYLTYAIVQSSRGKIWFESEEGKGTTFWFVLPTSGSTQKEGEVSLDS